MSSSSFRTFFLLGLAVVLSCVLCIVAAVLLVPADASNAARERELEACALNGSCVHGNVHATTVIVDAPIEAANIPWAAPPLQHVNGVPPTPGAGALTVETFTGSNILIDTLTISTTQAIVVETLIANITTFVGLTSCVRPVLPACLDISGQACAGGALMHSCLPTDATFDTLTVNGALFVHNASFSEPMNITNATALNVTHVFVSQNLTLTNATTCTSLSPAVNQGCVHLGGYSCDSAPLSASCVPSSLPFYNVNVSNALDVISGGQVQCLGPPVDPSCYAGTLFMGDTTGTWTATQVEGFQMNGVGNVATPTASAALVWAVESPPAWELKPINDTAAQPDSLMARDVNRNSSATTTYSVAASIQNGAQCVGVGRTSTVTPDRLVYYMAASAAAPPFNSKVGSGIHILKYDAVSGLTSYIGAFPAVVNINSLHVHPNGTLYAKQYGGPLFLIDMIAITATPVCNGQIISGRPAFDYYGNLWALQPGNGFLSRYDWPACNNPPTVVKIMSPVPTGRHAGSVIIGTTLYYPQPGGIYSTDILDSNTVPTILPSPSDYPISTGYDFGGQAYTLYSECIDDAVYLGLWSALGPLTGNSTLLDPLSRTRLTGGRFRVTNAGMPGTVFAAGVNTASVSYLYPWIAGASNCYAPYPVPSGGCLKGNLDMENRTITRVDGLFADHIYPTSPPTNLTLNMAGNTAVATALRLYVGSANTSLSFSTAATTTAIIGPGGGPNALQVNNLVQAARFPSALVTLTLTPGAGAGTTAPVTLTATNARGCRWQVSVTTTLAPAPNSVIFNVAISGQTAFAPGVVFSPVGQNAAQLASTQLPYVANENINGFDFMSGSGAGLVASTNYQWNFQNCV